MLACLANPAVRGEVLNIGEPAVRSMRGWAGEILAAAGHEAELVTVPDPTVPEDMWMTRSIDQHLLIDCGKASETTNKATMGCITLYKRTTRLLCAANSASCH